MNLIEKLKNRFQRQPKEVDPWKIENQKEATAEDMEKAVKKMNTPLPKQRKWLYKAGAGFAMLWFFFHVFPLYVMIGTPISAGFFLIIMVNALFMIPSIKYLYEKAI